MATSALSQFWSKKWEDGQLCDVLIEASDGKTDRQMACHSFILAPVSAELEILSNVESFDKRTTSDESDLSIELDSKTGKLVVKHKKVSFDEWQAFVRFLYYGTLWNPSDKTQSREIDLGSHLISASRKLCAHESVNEAIQQLLANESCSSSQAVYSSLESDASLQVLSLLPLNYSAMKLTIAIAFGLISSELEILIFYFMF